MQARWFSLALLTLLAMPAAALAPPAPAGQGPAPYFSANVRVDSSPVAYVSGNPVLAISPNGTLFAAFAGYTGTATGFDIYVTRSTDHGLTWSRPVKVNDDSGAVDQTAPTLTIDRRGYLYLAWVDARNAAWGNDIYYARSTDNGTTFTAPNVRVNDGNANVPQSAPTIAVDSIGRVCILWVDPRNAGKGPDIYFSNSTNGGATWLAPAVIVNDDAGAAAQGAPVLRVGPSDAYYAMWDDMRNSATRNRDIYFSKSTNGGSSWSANILVNDDTANQEQKTPTMAVASDGTIEAAWEDYRTQATTGADVYFTKSTSGGSSFFPNVHVETEAGYGFDAGPSLAVTPSANPVIAWTFVKNWGGGTNPDFDVYVSWSADGGATFVPQVLAQDTLDYSIQALPSVAVAPDGTIQAIWADYREGPVPQVYGSHRDPVAPTAAFTLPPGGDQHAALAFVDRSTDNMGVVARAWDFGDGTTSTLPNPTHAYAEAGTHTVTLTVTDASGNSATVSGTVDVNDVTDPTAAASLPASAPSNTTLAFDATDSTDNVAVVGYHWDFGDGATAEEATALHAYGNPGTYTVTLTVSDAAGNTRTITNSLTVTPGPDPTAELRSLQNTVTLVAAGFGVGAAVLFLVGFLLGRRRTQGPGSLPPPGTAPPP